MVDKLSNYLLNNLLIKDESISEEKKEVLLFGITRIIEDIPKYIGIFIICLILGILKECLLVFAITIVYKTFIGGAHARTNLGCFLYSTAYFIGPIILAQNLILSPNILNVVYSLIFLLSIYVIIKIAPADTEEVPIINKKLRNKLKILAATSLSLIYLFAFFVIKDTVLINIIMIVIAVIDIMSTKIIYKLLKCKYSYESEEIQELLKD